MLKVTNKINPKTMKKINSVSIHFVRNEYEYNKYLSDSYKDEFEFADVEDKLPLVVIDAERQDFGTVALLCYISFSPEVDMTDFVDTDDLIVSVDKHSVSANFANLSQVVFSVPDELGLDTTETMVVTLTDPDSDETVSSTAVAYTVKELMEKIENEVSEQGSAVGEILLEVIILLQKVATSDTYTTLADFEILGEFVHQLDERVQALESPV